MKANIALIALLEAGLVATQTNDTWPPSELPLYGLSPPVYPSPIGQGSTNAGWASAYKRARALVSQMTLDEKNNLTQGFEGSCVGATGTVERLGIPSLCFADAPDGLRGQEFVSSFPAGIHVASTFDKNLMYDYGRALGQQYYAKGVNVILGPCAGPMGRMARGGRNWEGLSADPYLAGIGMGAITKGIQDQGVIATPKHYLFNEQEYRRFKGHAGESISSNVDDRTLHELYGFPFMDALHAGAGAVLCGYNAANYSYVCQNSKLLNGILKTELGFEGFIVSDWYAQNTGIAGANAGLDVVMPVSSYWGYNLTDAVNNGSVDATRLDDMATRVLASFYYLRQENTYPSPAIYTNAQKHFPVNAQGWDHAGLIHEIGAAGTVLVKNVNGTLPLKNPKFLNIYGYDATTKAVPWENYARFGGGYEVNFNWTTFNGTLIVGGGSGSNTPPYVYDPFMALTDKMRESRGTLRWDFWSENPSPAYVNAEHCLVFINAYASESYDRVTLKDEFSDNLVKNTAANCSSTIVIIHNAGIRVVDEWIDNPNVTAVIFAGLPGQEAGSSIVSVLYGDVNPSGRLPYTVAKNESDYGHLLNSTVSADWFPGDNFTEGLFIDYRFFDKEGIEPQFEFGFGLSYTTFEYEALSTALVGNADNETFSEYPDPDIAIIQGGHPELWDVIAVVKCVVSNSGEVDGTEVPQLYITIPYDDTPAKQLRGFQRIGPLAPLQSGQAVFELTRRDLSIWDVVAQQWRLNKGEYQVFVGASSRDFKLNGTFTI
ncbi:putative beta-glucosidase M [Cytospora mali]|uniref:beta-glucosidase n=1 Tax=Cytospora mali TaxID=578113 RepID=A0A194VN16_CYTMA|nr:putative beta-glucosidase M [Valsa mali]